MSMQWFSSLKQIPFAHLIPTAIKPQPPEARAAELRRVYEEMLRNLQHSMLLLLVTLSIPLSIYFGVFAFRDAFISLHLPREVFLVHVTSFVLSISWICVFHERRVLLAWAGVIIIALLSNYVQIQLTHSPGILFFLLLTIVGPLIAFRLRHILIVILAVMIMTLASTSVPVQNTNNWSGIVSLFFSLVLGFIFVGIAIRRFVRSSAQMSVCYKEIASTKVREEQRVDDLKQHFEKISSLEHDIRQPLRTAQGCLNAIASDALDDELNELVLPAIAATQRAERLLCNLLDESRDGVAHASAYFRFINVEQLFSELESQVAGLARYYTSSRASVRLSLDHPLPIVRLDREQFERALFNLLDNALAQTSHTGVVHIRVWASRNELCVSISDNGPGLPTATLDALTNRSTPKSGLRLGLRQVQRAIQMHKGRLDVQSDKRGTSIAMYLPAR